MSPIDAIIHFRNEGSDFITTSIYRNHDGYPSGLGKDLERFFEDVKKNVSVTRFNDASYLAAKFIVWQANEYSKNAASPTHFLDFSGVGIDSSADLAVDYVYGITCFKDGRKPMVGVNDLRENE